MAATTITLSSSPPPMSFAPTPPHAIPPLMSSSPSLPSPSQLFSTMPSHIPNGSRAAVIPQDAVKGFASASTLLRQEQPHAETSLPPNAFRLGLAERYKLSGPSTKETKSGPSELLQKQVRKSTKVKTQLLSKQSIRKNKGDEDQNKEVVPPKKSRKKKAQDIEKQSTIEKSKITKPGREAPTKDKEAVPTTKKKRSKKASTMSVLLEDVKDAPAATDLQELGLKEAVKRRRAWTPTRERSKRPKEDLDDAIGALADTVRKAPSLETYGFALPKESSVRSAPELHRQVEGSIFVKRKKIELVDNFAHPSVAVEKQKRARSPTKKAQTITDKATAPFIPIEGDGDSSLLQFLAQPQEPKDSMQTSRAEKARKARSKSKSKPIPARPRLLSPTSAMKKVNDQELIFGTSSQLAKDESPTFLKDLQQAMRESESMPIPQASHHADGSFQELPLNTRQRPKPLKIGPTRSLWTAGARNLDDSLLGVESIDLANPDRVVASNKSVAQHAQKLERNVDDSFQDIDAHCDSAEASLVSKQPMEEERHSENTSMLSSCRTLEHEKTALSKSESIVNNIPCVANAKDAMPNYEGYTDAQLSKEIASYRFKPVKKREAMISLLKQCWESQRNLALQEMPDRINWDPKVSTTSPEKSAASTNILVKKKGRPPKSASKAASTDSADISPPKKARGRPRKLSNVDSSPAKPKDDIPKENKARLKKTKSRKDENAEASAELSPRREQASDKSKTEPLVLEPNSDRERLMETITTAVKTYPPSNDPAHFTWYEKILMYEPIVIEDLRLWLNREGLSRIDEDDEVDDLMVKAWCEGRSVCCVWRETARGNQRVRY